MKKLLILSILFFAACSTSNKLEVSSAKYYNVACHNCEEIVDNNACKDCVKTKIFSGLSLTNDRGYIKYLEAPVSIAFKDNTHVILNGTYFSYSNILNASNKEEFIALLDCLKGAGSVPDHTHPDLDPLNELDTILYGDQIIVDGTDLLPKVCETIEEKEIHIDTFYYNIEETHIIYEYNNGDIDSISLLDPCSTHKYVDTSYTRIDTNLVDNQVCWINTDVYCDFTTKSDTCCVDLPPLYSVDASPDFESIDDCSFCVNVSENDMGCMPEPTTYGLVVPQPFLEDANITGIDNSSGLFCFEIKPDSCESGFYTIKYYAECVDGSRDTSNHIVVLNLPPEGYLSGKKDIDLAPNETEVDSGSIVIVTLTACNNNDNGDPPPTGDIDNVIVTDTLRCFDILTTSIDVGGAPNTPGTYTHDPVTGELIWNLGATAIPPFTCEIFTITGELACSSDSIDFFQNFAEFAAEDATSGNPLTDTDFEILPFTDIPEAFLTWNNNGVPDWQNGTVIGNVDWIKQPSESVISGCEPSELIVYVNNCDGSLFGTYNIIGDLCTPYASWIDGGNGTLPASDLLSYLLGTPTTVISFDKRTWANALGFIHQDLELPLSRDCECNNHTAKFLDWHPFVGGSNAFATAINCPIQSSNEDRNDTVYYKMFNIYTTFWASQNGGNRYEVISTHLNDPVDPIYNLGIPAYNVNATGGETYINQQVITPGCGGNGNYKEFYELALEGSFTDFEITNASTWSNGMSLMQNAWINGVEDFSVWLRCNNRDKCDPIVGLNMTVENQQNGVNNTFGSVSLFQLTFNGVVYPLTLPSPTASGITTRGQLVDLSGEGCGFYPIKVEADNQTRHTEINGELYRNVGY